MIKDTQLPRTPGKISVFVFSNSNEVTYAAETMHCIGDCSFLYFSKDCTASNLSIHGDTFNMLII